MSRYLVCIASISICIIVALSSEAATPSRVALVIGNAKYDGKMFGVLCRNPDNQTSCAPLNDAYDMAKQLREFGFEVIVETDVDRAAMMSAVQQFAGRLHDGGIGFFFCSSHGIQEKGFNYLIPLGTNIEFGSDIKHMGVDVEWILDTMEAANPNGANILILDACREDINYNFSRISKSSRKKGLAPMSSTLSGSLIAYAAAPNSYAYTLPDARNSVFTGHLLKVLKDIPHESLQNILSIVAGRVRKDTIGYEITPDDVKILKDKGDLPVVLVNDLLDLTDRGLLTKDVFLEEVNSLIEKKGLSDQVEGEKIKEFIMEEALKLRKQQGPQVFSGLDNVVYLAPAEVLPVSTLSKQPPPGREHYDPDSGILFIEIPSGCFKMGCVSGSGECSHREKPIQEVCLKSFWIGKFEVTQRQWEQIMADNPAYFPQENIEDDTGDYPIERVSYDDIQKYLEKLNQKADERHYRLPSETEWEYAARAETDTVYSFGNDVSELDEYAWYLYNSKKRTHQVGQLKPNAWNLYDMYGNVWEWVADPMHKNYYDLPKDGSTWEEDGSKSLYVLRGGAWSNDPSHCRSAVRHWDSSDRRYSTYGFRVVLESALQELQ